MIPDQSERFHSIAGFEDRGADRAKHLADEGTNTVLVFGEQNGLVSVRERAANFRCRMRNLVLTARQVHLEGGAVADLAVDGDMPTALLDDPVDGGQTQSGSFSWFLGGEEGL